MSKTKKDGKSLKDAKMPNIKAPHIGPRPRRVGPIGGVVTSSKKSANDKARNIRKK